VNKLPGVILLAPLFFVLLVCSCGTLGHTEKKDDVDVVALQKKDNIDVITSKIEKPEFIFHKVMAGETLGSIARWYTGSESLWHKIADDNPKLNSSRLRIGDIVKVSVSLATVHKEQPSYSTKSPKATKKTNREPGAEEIDPSATPAPEEIFGPR
jgi:hypothetical protein